MNPGGPSDHPGFSSGVRPLPPGILVSLLQAPRWGSCYSQTLSSWSHALEAETAGLGAVEGGEGSGVEGGWWSSEAAFGQSQESSGC